MLGRADLVKKIAEILRQPGQPEQHADMIVRFFEMEIIGNRIKKEQRRDGRT
jgi:hypothetical protein